MLFRLPRHLAQAVFMKHTIRKYTELFYKAVHMAMRAVIYPEMQQAALDLYRPKVR